MPTSVAKKTKTTIGFGEVLAGRMRHRAWMNNPVVPIKFDRAREYELRNLYAVHEV